jgi:hypothetical protein
VCDPDGLLLAQLRAVAACGYHGAHHAQDGGHGESHGAGPSYPFYISDLSASCGGCVCLYVIVYHEFGEVTTTSSAFLRLCVWQDIIYFPKKWDPILYVDTLPNVYAAHVRFPPPALSNLSMRLLIQPVLERGFSRLHVEMKPCVHLPVSLALACAADLHGR